jgi:hypothetical protein
MNLVAVGRESKEQFMQCNAAQAAGHVAGALSLCIASRAIISGA